VLIWGNSLSGDRYIAIYKTRGEGDQINRPRTIN
jgi:hypothetical protein